MNIRNHALRGAAFVAAFAATILPAAAAGGPFGVGTPDAPSMPDVSGPLGGLLLWSIHWQTIFYGHLTAALSDFSTSPAAAGWLIGLSFLYGVLHAVGPGHGKTVIASYLVATGDGRRRAVLLSAAAGAVQAASAIVIVTLAALVFDATAVEITHATDTMEIASYALIVGIGIALLAGAVLRLIDFRRPAMSASGFACLEMPSGATIAPLARTDTGRHAPGCMCADVARLASDQTPATLGARVATIVSIGIRPCSGALIVLVFALSQHIFAIGMLSVVAMSVGTVATVGAVALLVSSARGLVLRLSARHPRSARWLPLAGRFAGGFVITVFGLLMVTGALAADGIRLP